MIIDEGTVEVTFNKQVWPISRCHKNHLPGYRWEFVKETEPCTYLQALKEAGKLQLKRKRSRNCKWEYRIWDCR